jgi:hypothetical protein
MPHCTIDATPAAPTILGAIKRTGTLTMQFATQTAPMRVFLGFVAGAISVLTFHQGLWALFYAFGAMPMPPFPTRPMPPFSVPLIVSLCFWGGLYGAVFGLLRPRFTRPLWLCGLIMGIIAALVGMFIVSPIKGMPLAFGWMAWPILRAFLINGCWGVGVGLILPLLLPRSTAHAGTGLQAFRR